MASISHAPRERNLLDRVGIDVDPDASNATRNPIKAVRRHCLECSGGSSKLVEECPSSNCALFPFRLGKNPYRAIVRAKKDNPA